jgi:hypothetical protein
MVIEKIKNTIVLDRKLIIITFEIFWIIVFVINKITSSDAVDIPQFIYVNF